MFKWFYNISWTLQLGVGLVLFGVTAVLEALVLAAYLESLWLGVFVAGGLEAAKVLTIVLYRILNGQSEVPYPRGVRWVTLGFRAMLLGLSAACSLMFLALHLDRPAMEAVRSADLATAEGQFRAALAAEQAADTERRDRLLARTAEADRRAREAVSARYLPAITDLESRLSTEMNNVQGGEFKGKRYKALQERLATEKAAYDQARADLERTGAGPQRELDRLDDDRRARVAALTAAHQSRVDAIRKSDYQGDARAEQPMARAFVNVLSAIFAHQPTTLQFVFYFALFLAVTMELGIWVAFEHLTLARLPVFTAGYRADLEVASKVVAADSALRGFEVEDELARAKVRRKQRGIADLLRGGANDKLA